MFRESPRSRVWSFNGALFDLSAIDHVVSRPAPGMVDSYRVTIYSSRGYSVEMIMGGPSVSSFLDAIEQHKSQ